MKLAMKFLVIEFNRAMILKDVRVLEAKSRADAVDLLNNVEEERRSDSEYVLTWQEAKRIERVLKGGR